LTPWPLFALNEPLMRPLVNVVLLIALVPVLLSAQNSTPRRIFVAALDAAGAPVTNLTIADFVATENDVPREVTRAQLGTRPLRVVLLVDSSHIMAPLVKSFREALDTFADTLPPEHEISFISTGSQIRVRTQPSTDRAELKAQIARFTPDNGANSMLETMYEADTRFLKAVPDQWPAIVILTTDNGDTRREPRVDAYNRFMNDFVARGGIAHSIVLEGKQVGPISELTQNLIDNTGGTRFAVNTEHVLPVRMKELAERLADDHRVMRDRYVIEIAGDPKVTQPIVNVKVNRGDVRVQMSGRRPF
jgi:hypothetical protein